MRLVSPDVLSTLMRSIFSFTVLPEKPISGVAVDSRNVREGDLFFALPGEKTDGHHFVQEAIQKGASCIVSRRLEQVPIGVGLVCVSDGLEALQRLAHAVVQYASPMVIGVTGSLGKTTTKEYTKSLLEACGPTASTEESCNSQIGLAISSINTLLRMKKPAQWFVAEMGMTEKGHITKLVSIIPPHIACVTQIAPVHVQNFPDVEAIAHAKAEIFSSPHCASSLINIDSPHADVLLRAGRGKVKTMSMKKQAEYSLRCDENSMIFTHEGKTTCFQKPLFRAEHQFENLLHAMALACEAGGDVGAFQSALSSLHMIGRRLEFIQKRGILFINDSYNASEPSMMAALGVLKKTKGKRKIGVFGQMRELGAFSKGCHERVGIQSRDICDMAVCLGEECEPLFRIYQESKKPAVWFLSLQEVKEFVSNTVREGDVVLLKGSKSNKLWEVVEEFVCII